MVSNLINEGDGTGRTISSTSSSCGRKDERERERESSFFFSPLPPLFLLLVSLLLDQRDEKVNLPS
jgi:hypothetical protein